jgi:hypothetical protein
VFKIIEQLKNLRKLKRKKTRKLNQKEEKNIKKQIKNSVRIGFDFKNLKLIESDQSNKH